MFALGAPLDACTSLADHHTTLAWAQNWTPPGDSPIYTDVRMGIPAVRYCSLSHPTHANNFTLTSWMTLSEVEVMPEFCQRACEPNGARCISGCRTKTAAACWLISIGRAKVSLVVRRQLSKLFLQGHRSTHYESCIQLCYCASHDSFFTFASNLRCSEWSVSAASASGAAMMTRRVGDGK